MTTTSKNIITWLLKSIAAVIMLQTLFYKFTAAPESVYIFSRLGMEPWGRIGTGILELVASLLILVPRTAGIGSLMGLGIMGGALFFHLTRLGIVVQNDSGQLFIYAILVFVSCMILTVIYRKELLSLFSKMKYK